MPRRRHASTERGEVGWQAAAVAPASIARSATSRIVTLGRPLAAAASRRRSRSASQLRVWDLGCKGGQFQHWRAGQAQAGASTHQRRRQKQAGPASSTTCTRAGHCWARAAARGLGCRCGPASRTLALRHGGAAGEAGSDGPAAAAVAAGQRRASLAGRRAPCGTQAACEDSGTRLGAGRLPRSGPGRTSRLALIGVRTCHGCIGRRELGEGCAGLEGLCAGRPAVNVGPRRHVRPGSVNKYQYVNAQFGSEQYPRQRGSGLGWRWRHAVDPAAPAALSKPWPCSATSLRLATHASLVHSHAIN